MSDPSASNIVPVEGLQEQLATLTVSPSAAQVSNVRQRRTILDDLSGDDSDDDGDFAPESDNGSSDSDSDSSSSSSSDSDSDSGSEKEDAEEDAEDTTEETDVIGSVDSKVLRTGKTIKVVTDSETVEATVVTTAIVNK